MKVLIFLLLFIKTVYADITYTTIKNSFVEVDFTRISGHFITVGSGYTDWRGTPPEIDNTGIYSSNEYVYKDALNDDLGDGDYTYPTNKIFKSGMADIKEFRATCSSNYLYLYVELLNASPDSSGWWIQGLIIGINEEDSIGSYYFIEGDGIDSDSGPAAELNSDIKIKYTLFASATYRVKIWDYTGKKIGDGDDSDNSDGTLNNMKVSADEWNKYEIGIPFSLIGDIRNKKIKFFVGSCFEENKMVREVQGYPLITEWYITGGDQTWWDNKGTDPDVVDLIGAEKDVQISDLNNYKEFFYNPDKTFDVFNFEISPYIFKTGTDKNLTVFFTAEHSFYATITVKDMNNNVIKTLMDNSKIEVGNVYNTTEIYWDGTDNKNKLLKRGIYIIEGKFIFDKETKIIRKVVRIW